MAQGLEIFRNHFSTYTENYVLIGGMACYLADPDFRATKDLDLVIVVENLSAAFHQSFWDFIRAGGYEHIHQVSGETQFYRFKDPQKDDYPFMLELFCKAPGSLTLPADVTITPVGEDDPVSSLSAILLDDAAYQFVLQGKLEIDGISTLAPDHIIPLKALAFLNLSQQKAENPASVDTKHIKKHKNDVFRMLATLTGDERIILPPILSQAMNDYLNAMESETIAREILGISGYTQSDAIAALRTIYLSPA